MRIAAWLRELSATLGVRTHGLTMDDVPARLALDADDALVAYLERRSPTPLVVEDLEQPAGWVLQHHDVRLLVPLVTQGRLVGLLGLGAPAAERTYSTDDLLFLTALARAAAPAVRIAQLRARERAVAHRVPQVAGQRDAAGWAGTP